MFDGGLDWEGTLFRAAGPNLFTYLPTALRHYPAYAATGDQAAHDAMIRAGFAHGSEFLWPYHYSYYWDLTQRLYREEFDPSYDGALKAGTPFCQSGTPSCDADYHYGSRPQAVKDAMRSVQLTGKIGKPMITVHGTLDTLLPIRTDSEPLRPAHRPGRAREPAPLLQDRGRHPRRRALRHLPDKLRPLLPCARTGFSDLTRWVERGVKPPRDGYYHRPASGDLRNTCRL